MNDDVGQFPLAWPVGRPRTRLRQRARFSMRSDSGGAKELSVSRACDRLSEELERLGAVNFVISTNVRPTIHGWPKSQLPVMPDPGVAVYFTLKGKPHCLACDRWDRVADNLAAIAAEIAANRGRERWGVVTLEEAFSGFAALPAQQRWWQKLGFEREPRGISVQALKEHFRTLARKHHPDVGGDAELMKDLSVAYEEGLRILEEHP